jgi:hypothetical protein
MIAAPFIGFGVGPSLWLFGIPDTKESKDRPITEAETWLVDKSAMS